MKILFFSLKEINDSIILLFLIYYKNFDLEYSNNSKLFRQFLKY